MRAVFDPNVLVSGLLSPRGTPGHLVGRWREGHFDLVISPLPLRELATALEYPKLRKGIAPDDAAAFIALLRQNAQVRDDPSDQPRRSRDAKDDYLIALAQATDSVLVSGDPDLLSLAKDLPIRSPREFLALLDRA